jgi:hypothetical protein
MSTYWWIAILIFGCIFSGCFGFFLAAMFSVTGDEDYIIVKGGDTYE